MRHTPFALMLLATFVASPARGAEPAAVQADERVLKEAKVATDAAGLIAFFRGRIPAEAVRDNVEELIKQLGNDDFQVRENATAALLALGAQATPLLRIAAKEDPNGDFEVIRRAQKILKGIDRVAGPAVTQAAARLLGHHKPEGACDVLLDFVPYAEDEGVSDEVRRALIAAGFQNGKPNATLTEALGDEDGRVRSAAAFALIAGGTAEQRKPLKKLLTDAEPLVRLRAGLAFFDHKETDSIPALISVLGDLPPERLWTVEDALNLVAGEKSPTVTLGNDKASREKCREAWAGWWAKEGRQVDLAKLDLSQRLKGLTLLVDLNRGLNGRVYEIGQDGKVRWELANLNYPIDAEMVGDDRLLVAEYRKRRVAEMDLKGNVKWEKAVNGYAIGVQRLPDGNTLIVSRTQLIEVNGEGKDVKTINIASIAGARKMADGGYAVLTATGNCLVLDKNGKQEKSFAVQANTAIGGGRIDVTPGGRILVAITAQNKVVEYDRDGKVVWQANVQTPSSVMRLPNGRTLVSSSTTQRVVELDRSGREVWEHKSDGRVMSVRKR